MGASRLASRLARGLQLLSAAGQTECGGGAYLFDANTGGLLQTFAKPGPIVNDQFGLAVTALGADKLAISAPRDDLNVANSGTVYVFHTPSGALLQTIQKPVPASDDQFGVALAGIGDRVLVGTPLDDAVALDAGAVYSFGNTSCGNGTIDAGEACDDGNLVSGDGCDANCTATGCGNGIVTAGEICDDGNLLAGDGCSPTCTLEGTCGDGVVAPFEACDDGNLVSGDGCDANCTATGCGNGIVTAGEQCDLGTDNGAGLCCSVSCTSVDGDGDGVCDQNDVCPTLVDPLQANKDGDAFGDACDVCPTDSDNDSDGDLYCVGPEYKAPSVGGGDPCSRGLTAGAWEKPKVILGRVLFDAPGNESLRLQGAFVKGSDVPVLSPDRYGVQVRVTDNDAAIVLDVHIPAGVLLPGGDHGWKAFGRPVVKWIFTDKRKDSPLNGIRKFAVKDRSRFVPNQVAFSMKAKGGTYPVMSESQLPLRAAVELNDNSLPPGGTPGRDQCGEAVFVVDGTGTPSCKVIGDKKVVCR